MTFDYIVGNPPFKGSGSLYLQILDVIKDVADKIVCVLPATWLIDEREKHNRYADIRKSLNGKLKEAVLFNGNHVFGIKSFVPIAIIVVDMNAKNSQLVITDMMRGGEVDVYDDVFNVNLFGNNEIRKSLKNKILKAAKRHNLWNSPNLYSKRGKGNAFDLRTLDDKKKYLVKLRRIRGRVYTTSEEDELFSYDFYTIVSRSTKVQKLKRPFTQYENEITGMTLNYFFETHSEAENFLAYLKTKFARFALSIYKKSCNLMTGELSAIPRLDFNMQWDDEKLRETFAISDKEWQFIEEHISDYYDENN